MKKMMKSITENKLFERIYKVGVGIKGFDGLVELVVGLALLVSPQLVHNMLASIVTELGEHQNHTLRFIAEYIARVDGELAKSGLVFLIIFLTSHGLIKLALVYCLLKEIVRAYPIALAVLGLFLLYQMYVFVLTPTIGMALFTVLDVVIIWLVWGEYKKLKAEKVV